MCIVLQSNNPNSNTVRNDTTPNARIGVRTFLTGYAADGQVIEWGTKYTRRIYHLGKQWMICKADGVKQPIVKDTNSKELLEEST
jgi:hypothetical protein